MVEWFKAAVLKTAEAQVSEGSNPSLSAIFFPKKWRTKTQVFSSLCEAQLHSKGAAFSSHLHQKREALLACPAIARRATADEDAPFHSACEEVSLRCP